MCVCVCVCEQETTLADLLQLNLHCFEEEVRDIVDKASKEMGMEKMLAELNDTWTGEASQLFRRESDQWRTQIPHQGRQWSDFVVHVDT